MRISWTIPLVLWSGMAVHAENWPQWRGPLGSGVSSERNLPERWSATEHVAWRAKLPGVGVSSPVVFGDRVFVTAQAGSGMRREGNHPTAVQGEDAKGAGERTLAAAATLGAGDRVTFFVSAYQASDGRELWKYEVPAEGALTPVHDKHNLATPSPVTDGKLVYAWFGTGQVVALDMNGKLAWKRNLGAENSPFTINWGHSSSPALHDDLLILLCYHEPASYLLALDKHTGKERWKTDRGREIISYSTPIVISGERGPELMSTPVKGSRPTIRQPASCTGAHRKPAAFHPRPNSPRGDDVYHEGLPERSLSGRAPRRARRCVVQPCALEGGHRRALRVVSRSLRGTPLHGQRLGIVSVIDAATGERVWRERVGGIFMASPVAGDGKIYLVSETGETVVLKAGRPPQVLARNKLDDRLSASPAISGGKLFLRGDDQLVAIGR